MTKHNPDTVLTAFYFTLETLLRRGSLFDLDADVMLGLMSCAASPSFEHGQYLACKHIANMRSIAVSYIRQRNAFPEARRWCAEQRAHNDASADGEIIPQSLRADLYACNPDESAEMREAFEETLHGLGDSDGGEGQ